MTKAISNSSGPFSRKTSYIPGIVTLLPWNAHPIGEHMRMNQDRTKLGGGREAAAARGRRLRNRFRADSLLRLEDRIVMTLSTTLVMGGVSAVYGGDATLSATLTANGSPVANEIVDFHMGSTDLGESYTNSSGIAPLNNVSTSFMDAGTYSGDLTATFAGDGTYTASNTSANLTITPAPLGVTANAASKVYGQANPTFAGTYSGIYNGDNVTATFTTPASQFSDVQNGGYPINFVGLSGSKAMDYSTTVAGGSSTSGTLTITQAPVTIDVANASKVYGTANPTFGGAISGVLDGDNVTTSFASTATTSSHVQANGYPITAGPLAGTKALDYSVSANNPATLTITTAPLTITANNASKAYGAAMPSLTASYAGFVNGDTSASLSTQPSLSSTATTASHVAGSPYAITAGGAADSDYAISYVGGSLSVTTAPLTITANNASKAYGAAVPTLVASYTGFVNGDTSASLMTLPSVTSTATTASHVAGSPYAITAGGAADSDYAISYTSGNLTVTAAPLTITAVDASKVYGAAMPSLTASYTGFVNGDTSASLAQVPSVTSTATTASHVAGSPYAITAGGAADSDYTISYTPGSLTVTPAPLMISATNATKVYGAALPTLTASYSGLVNGDTPASLDTSPTLTTTATPASHVADGPFAVTAAGAVDGDYTISYSPGTLTVTPAPLTITPDDASKVYGATAPTFTASYTGFVNGDTSASLTTLPTLTTLATAASHVAGGPYAITASGAVDGDYAITDTPGNLTVTPAPLTVTPDDVTKAYGVAVPTLTASYAGFVNGDTPSSLTTPVALSTTATINSDFGTYPITASGGASSDYAITNNQGTLTVPADPDGVGFVTSLYQAILDRDPEPNGLNSFLARLNNGMTQYQVVNVIYNSAEAVDDRASAGASSSPKVPGQIALVSSLYEQILGRSPEPSGLDGWILRLNSGATPIEVAEAIYASPEASDDRAGTPPFQATSTAEVALVTGLYENILDRDPEASGLQSWLDELDGGKTAIDIAIEIYNSPEAEADRNN